MNFTKNILERMKVRIKTITLNELLEVFDYCETTKVTIQDKQCDDVRKEKMLYDPEVLNFFFYPDKDEMVILTSCC